MTGPSRRPALTRSGYAVATTALGFGLLGVALGNFQLLLLAVAPVAFLAYTVDRDRFARPEIQRDVSPLRPRRGDRVHVHLRVRVPEGSRAVEVHQPLPDGVLLEEGTNVTLLAPGTTTDVRFTLRVPKRGRFEIPPVRWEAVHLPGLLGSIQGRAAPAVEVHVRPRFRAPHGAGDRLAASARTPPRLKAGPRTTDFADVREYAWGDAMRDINWKASARRLSTGTGARPLVNEHEHEDRGSALILLDAGSALDVGTDLETGLDHALEAAYALAAHFLSRGLRVGFHAAHAAAAAPVAPDAGPEHLRRIRDTLSRIEPATAPTLADAVRDVQGYLRGGGRVVLITRVTPPGDDLREALRTLRGLLPRHQPPAVLDVRATLLAPAGDVTLRAAHTAVERGCAALAEALRADGVHVARWDPRTRFTPALLRRHGHKTEARP